LEPIELIEPFGFEVALGGGDCVGRSLGLSVTPFGGAVAVAVAADDGVPSDVWMLRLAGGRPAAGGALFFDLNRNAIVGRFLSSAARFSRKAGRGCDTVQMRSRSCDKAVSVTRSLGR
jgi:hypothetical protein